MNIWIVSVGLLYSLLCHYCLIDFCDFKLFQLCLGLVFAVNISACHCYYFIIPFITKLQTIYLASFWSFDPIDLTVILIRDLEIVLYQTLTLDTAEKTSLGQVIGHVERQSTHHLLEFILLDQLYRRNSLATGSTAMRRSYRIFLFSLPWVSYYASKQNVHLYRKSFKETSNALVTSVETEQDCFKDLYKNVWTTRRISEFVR